MFWNLLILVLGVFSAIFALPYGSWEIKKENKCGGMILYLLSAIVILLSFEQML